ncbi:coatomer subunit epsilon-1-like [Micractinium conductrix]|uniref:Coatomer subunit epsilon n=1 Tax=Micractinium conductrix TaxID=554055 RepID=A0A2P6VNK6_9CHLO|nr:coatomer subunit epsilon-1-like [Micractinium conductrix]|eukprot:PSC75635.1 coatomer subunit epsilon-1-like [Micractinium conductrix]
MGDALFALRTAYHTGAFQACISLGATLVGLSEADRIERDCYVMRSYVELGSHELVLSEVGPSSPAALQAVRALALHAKGQRAEALDAVAGWLSDPACASNPSVLLVAGLLYALEENYVEALRVCHTGGSLEMMALCVHVYLKMDRLDLAERQAKAMAAVDDDATLSQLAHAWVGLHQGGAKVQEAFYIFQELGDKFSWTVRLHNSLAACQMRMGRWEDAESELLQAFEKNPKDADTLANLAAVSLHLGKPAARYHTQLKVVAPEHALVKRTEEGEAAFDRAAASTVTA